MEKKLMLGNEAVARGAYEAGVTVASSYPGTPSTEITEYVAKYDEIYCEWAPNEKVAVEVAAGAAIAGARSMSAMKHVGMNVAADPMFTASYTGVNGGLVLCVADDPGMHSSQNEQDSRHYAVGAKLPMLEPADSGECKEFMKRAYEISESFDTPVILRLTTRIAHSQSVVELEERDNVALKEYKKDAAKFVMVPANAKPKHVIVEERCRKLESLAEETDLNRIEKNGVKIGIITSGITYQYAKEAVPEASILKLGMVNPMPKDIIRRFADSVDTCYVVEELDPVIETFCKSIGVNVIGKEIFTLLGEYSVNMVREAITGEKPPVTAEIKETIPVRPPVMCPGCSHRGVFYVLSKLGMRVSGDIGCYSLGCGKPLESIDTIICMGASISAAMGMEKARGKDFSKGTVSVLGDSTFIHSGITGLIDVVYNKGNTTTIILDNSITGMTGHQENPSTGYTIRGEKTRQVDLEQLCHAVGVDRVVVCDPFDLDQFEKIVKEETSAEEPSVIIAQRPCALIKKANYSGCFQIDQDKCKKCKMCLKLGCPAISLSDNEVKIDETQCVGCELCPNVCKFGAIKRIR